MTARPLRTAVVVQRADDSLVFGPYEVGQIIKVALPAAGPRMGPAATLLGRLR